MTKMTPKTDNIQKDAEAIQDSTPINKENPNLDKILERLDNLESENQELREQVKPENAFKKGKERYKWPRHYSFKLWGGKPVLDYTSEKKDPTRDLVYKNQYGEFTENQLLNLTLLKEEWKTESKKVLVTAFNDWFNRSDKMEAKIESNWDEVISYTFDTKEFWKFTIQPKVVN